MSKKLLSVVLALALVLSCFAVSAFAIGGIGYESEEDAAFYTQTWALDEPVDNGNGTYSVNVRLTANYDVGTMQFVVLKNISEGSLTLTGASLLGTDIPAAWDASISFSNANGKVMIIPNPAVDAVPALDCTAGKVVAKLTYKASADVAATLAIDVANVKSQTNPAGTLIAARMSDKNVVTGTSILGQTVNATNTVAIGNAAPPAQAPKLVVVDGTLGVIDTSRTDIDVDNGITCDGYLLGFDPDNNGSLEELFAVEGDGEMVIEATAEGSETATGTMVKVVDLDGNVVATYVVIVFGDLNGDGFVDTTDSSIIEMHDGWEERVVAYQEFAGDVNADFGTDTTDSSVIEMHDGWEERLDVATILAGFGFEF